MKTIDNSTYSKLEHVNLRRVALEMKMDIAMEELSAQKGLSYEAQKAIHLEFKKEFRKEVKSMCNCDIASEIEELIPLQNNQQYYKDQYAVALNNAFPIQEVKRMYITEEIEQAINSICLDENHAFTHAHWDFKCDVEVNMLKSSSVKTFKVHQLEVVDKDPVSVVEIEKGMFPFSFGECCARHFLNHDVQEVVETASFLLKLSIYLGLIEYKTEPVLLKKARKADSGNTVSLPRHPSFNEAA